MSRDLLKRYDDKITRFEMIPSERDSVLDPSRIVDSKGATSKKGD